MIRSPLRVTSKPKLSAPVMRKCAVCRELFQKRSMSHKACSPACAIEIVKDAKKLEENKIDKARRETLKTRSDWIKEAQIEFNKFIRTRDANLPCISCGRSTGAKTNAGHYLSVGSKPQLRFSEDNCHLQCEHCNTYLSGNQAAYRPRLIEKIGVDRVEWLEGPHDPMKYTVDQIKEIKATYRGKSKIFLQKLQQTSVPDRF